MQIGFARWVDAIGRREQEGLVLAVDELDQAYLEAKTQLDELLIYADSTGRTLFAALLGEAAAVFSPPNPLTTDRLPKRHDGA